MVLVIGGVFQGKRSFIEQMYHAKLKKTQEFTVFEDNEIIIFQNCHMYNGNLMERIALKKDKKVVCTTTVVGNAIVPIKKEERFFRDVVGMNNKILVKEATSVYRIWNGISERIK